MIQSMDYTQGNLVVYKLIWALVFLSFYPDCYIIFSYYVNNDLGQELNRTMKRIVGAKLNP